MPLTLHPHLKRRLHFDDDYHVHPEDVIENAPIEYRDPNEQDAKRQRVERIALQYLQGKRPVILSAALRGPFNDGWKNPWAAAKRTKRANLNKESGVGTHKIGRDAVKKPQPRNARRRTRSISRKTLQEQIIKSPEVARAAEHDAGRTNTNRTLDEVAFEPPTATLRGDLDISGGTEFHSVESDRCDHNRSSITNPFWLRRSGAEKQNNMSASNKGASEASPTRLRGVSPQLDMPQTPRLTVPKQAVGLPAPPVSVSLPNNIPSSASASMIISSPIHQFPVSGSGHAQSPAPQGQDDMPEHRAPSSVSKMQPAEVQVAATPLSMAARLENPLSRVKDTIQKHDSRNSNSQSRDRETLSREDVLRSAERLVDLRSSSSSQGSQREQPNRQASPETLQPSLSQQNGTELRPPVSSNEFMYKKVGVTKWTFSNAPRSKPRPVNFNSSPAAKTDITKPNKSATQDKDPSRQSHASRPSDMSTQAAMLLAHLEFQEGSPPSSLETSEPWSQSQEGTSQTVLPEMSPAMTPISVFRPQLGEPYSFNGVRPGPPLSTQDLFAAASPFACSTIKKLEAAQGSNFRVTMQSLDSPIAPNKRIPLKEKNSMRSTWSVSFEKGLGQSQESETRRSMDNVESIQFEKETELDGHGLDDAFRTTDSILYSLNSG